MNNGYGVVFNEAGLWSSGYLFITTVENSKNNYLIVREGPTGCINENFGEPEKNFSFNSNIKLCLILHYNKEYKYLNLKHLIIYLITLFV